MTPDCEKIKVLRLAKGWRAEDLASKAKRSLKSIQAVERCKSVYIDTLNSIAKALEVSVDGLIKGSTPEPIKSTERRFKVNVTIEGNIEDFDESEDLTKLLDLLKKLADLRGEIEPSDPREGNSVVVTLDMDESDVALLLASSEKGLLAEHGISDVSLVVPAVHEKCQATRRFGFTALANTPLGTLPAIAAGVPNLFGDPESDVTSGKGLGHKNGYGYKITSLSEFLKYASTGIEIICPMCKQTFRISA